jgi:predicted dehydrogenase
MPVEKVNVGLLGTGFVLDSCHLPIYSLLGESVNVVAVAGNEEGKVESFRKRWGIRRGYHGPEAIDRLCADPEIDVVDVSIPNYLHLHAVSSAAENHKGVICEKPLARNGEEAVEALDAVRRYDVIHCYAENQIFIPQVTKARQIIRDGTLGKITWIRSREAHSGPRSAWFYDLDRAGGGVLLDMGCHSIEVARNLLQSKPTAVDAWTATLSHKIKSEDNSLVLVKYMNGALSQCENSWTTKGGLDIRLEIFGTEGSIFVDITRETGMRVFSARSEEKAGYVVEKADAKTGWMYPVPLEPFAYGFYDELSYFLQCIRTGTRPSEAFEDGLVVNKIMDKAYQSSKNLAKWETLE